MRDLFILAVFALLSMTANAQEASAFESEEETTVTPEQAVKLNPNYFENAYILGVTTPQAETSSSVVVNQDYKQTTAYKHARNLRTAGIIVTAVGAASTLLCLAGYIDCKSQENGDSGLAAVLGEGYCLYGMILYAPVAIAGGIMWGIGQHKVNKVKAASNGLGLAFEF